jgi:negative regulator of flagellin synthesis FlgM
MKISTKDPSVRDAYVKQISQQQKEDAASKPGVKPVEKADTVNISDEARELQEAQKVLENIPDVQVEKVAKIKNQIENGTYEIKSGEIAEKMVKDSLLNEIL